MVERVVLLRDARWPTKPGVCCWRHGVSESFAAAGASVSSESWTPTARPSVARPVSAGPTKARAAWLPAAVRTPLVKTVKRSQRLVKRAMSRPTPAAKAQPLPAALREADLVIAESLEVAADLKGRLPAARVWALALPPEWLPPPASVAFAPLGTAGPAAAYTELLSSVSEWVGGLFTDSELARSSVERAASRTRVRVLLFPPLAADRPCPECAGASPAAVATPLDGTVEPADQLAVWRSLADAPQAELPYSFVAARRLGLAARWAPAARWDWPHETQVSPLPTIADAAPEAWTASVQDGSARTALAAARPVSPQPPRARRRALITGFDLKFARELGDQLAKRTDLTVTQDDWADVNKPSPHTDQRVAEAEAIFAEWARPSAVRMSRSKRPDQFLAVRLHRFEMEAPYPRDIVIDNVDAVVYIAPLFGRRIRDELGWPVEKLVYIPNYIDLTWFDRPKLPAARFTLGMVGIHGLIKRLDLGLDILREVRRVDNRFTLRVRSDMPWDNKYHWAKAEERDYAGWWSERIDNDPLLRGAVVFDRPGRDMARWYRQIGHMLSPSDFEGSHASITEGMASGSVPVVRPWPGAGELYAKQWLHASAAEAASSILASADDAVWRERSATAQAEIRETHDHEAVVRAWADLLHGDLGAARGHFERFTSF